MLDEDLGREKGEGQWDGARLLFHWSFHFWNALHAWRAVYFDWRCQQFKQHQHSRECGGVYLIGLYTLCIRRVVPLIRCDKACFKSLKLKLSSSPLSLPGVPYQRQYHTQNFDLPNVEMERLLRGGRGDFFCAFAALLGSRSLFFFILFFIMQ